jgi:Tat protein translocase TatC
MREFKKATEDVKRVSERKQGFRGDQSNLAQENLLADLAGAVEEEATVEPSPPSEITEETSASTEATTESLASGEPPTPVGPSPEIVKTGETANQEEILAPEEASLPGEEEKGKRKKRKRQRKEFLPMDEKKLPLTSHLQELRKRLILSFIATGVGFVICYAFADSLFDLLAKPLMSMMPAGGTLIFTSVAEAFFTYMKVGFIGGVILASPFILYQIWAFIAPGLFRHEKRYVVPFVLGGSLFFTLGVLFGYYVAIPVGFRFLLGFASDLIKPMPSMKEYLTFTIKFLLAFGLVFEFPVVLVLLEGGWTQDDGKTEKTPSSSSSSSLQP